MDTLSKGYLYLENGHLFEGGLFGDLEPRGGEVVFNTGLTGYQEIFTDPSYSGQIVVMTYPHIGNTGVNPQDMESQGVFLSGVVTRSYCPQPSNFRSTQALGSFLEDRQRGGISEVDTRHLTRLLRDEGAQRGVLFSEAHCEGQAPVEAGKRLLEPIPPMEGRELVSEVSCKKPYRFGDYAATQGCAVVYDFGVKHGILHRVGRRGFEVRVTPYNTPAEEVLAQNPSFVVLSNGPGDPATVPHATQEIQKLIGKVPILAICMGHQLLARAIGATTYKLKFGHHGINHPVIDKRTGEVLITSQNHGFAVDPKSLEKLGVEPSHINLNDGTVEGMVSEKDRFYSVQFHPEASPGPTDADTLFDRFIKGWVQ